MRPVFEKPRLLIAIGACVACAAAPGSALPAAGDGPYTPFPGPPGKRADRYVNWLNQTRLSRRVGTAQAEVPSRGGGGVGDSRDGRRTAEPVTPKQLERGVVLDGDLARPTGSAAAAGSRTGPFDRAGLSTGGGSPSPSALSLLLAGAVLAAGGGMLTLRRKRRCDGAL